MASAVQSAVRLPSPEPNDVPEELVSRKRSPQSRSPSRRRDAPPIRRRSRSHSPPARNGPLPRDVDRSRAIERARQLEMRQRDDSEPSKPLTEEEKQAAAKAEYEKLLNMRSGGVYIPPAKLRALQAQITDKTSKEWQRLRWEGTKKSINGFVNKVNVSNIKHIVPELFSENLIRGRGLFCRSIMKAQAAALPFTPVYAAMTAIVNTKLPQVGELLVNRLVVQFRKAFKRNDKSVCHSSTTFIAHLINQQVAHEMLAAQMLLLLLHKPTDDSVEIAVGLMKEVGQHIEEMNSQIALAVYDQFRSILHEADIDKRVQYMIEVLFQIRKDKYKDNPAIKEELDLVEEEDQITHRPGLDDQLSTEDGLNIFKFDAEWEANEEAYNKLKAEILGEASGSEDDDGGDGSDESSEDEQDQKEKAMEIKDQSNTDVVNLRRSIYLTIMSSGGFEEACHKLMRINLPAGREEELPSMIIECCSQERTFNKFYGLIGERFCKLNRLWRDLFATMFAKYYDTIHRYETNRLRIVAQFFGHLLASDAIEWTVFNVVHLNEDDTTSSSRIFIKILIEDLAAGVGLPTLIARFKSDELQPALTGMFPTDNSKNTRFSINFFTAIGMGVLTEGMREHLKNMPKPAPAALPAPKSPAPSSRGRSESVSSYSSYSSYSSRSDSKSRSPSDERRRGRSYTRSPTPRKRTTRREESMSRSRTPLKRRHRSPSYDSRSSPRKRGRGYSDSASRFPPRRRRKDSPSRSRSPPTRGENGGRRSYPESRSPPPKRGRSITPSASPQRHNGKGPVRDLPPTRKSGRRFDSESPHSQSRSPPRKVARRDDSRSLLRSPPRNSAPNRKRRRNTSSPEASRSPSPPPVVKKPSRENRPSKPNGTRDADDTRKKAEDDMSHIHPSRRGLMGGAGGRARASDFM